MHRLTRAGADEFRRSLIAKQNNRCALCADTLDGKTACLDHDHRTGHIRSVLCLNCNGIEGKIFNLCRRAKRQRTEIDFLTSVFDYWMQHNGLRDQPIHPSHRTKEEKRALANKRARKRRKARKGS